MTGTGAKSNMDRDDKKLLSPTETWANAYQSWNETHTCHITEYVENHQHSILLFL